jgi:WD40 repeat protein
LDKYRRICLGWTAFACVLIGLGFALDAWLPPAPRFVLHDAHLKNVWGEATLCADGMVLMTGILGQTYEDGWMCDSLRSWDTATGRERGRFFAGFAKADPPALVPYELQYSPGRRFCALVHANGLALADLVANKEWPAALTWDNARQGPRQFSPLYRLLQLPIGTRGLQEPVKLKTALELFSDMFGGKLPILVDKAAFETDLGPSAEDPYEEEVHLPPVPARMPMGTALRLVLAQIGKGRATYIVRRNYIEVTTMKHAGEDQVLVPVFSPRGSFVAVAEGLSNEHRLHVVACATGQRVASFPLHTEVVAYFGFTTDEELLYFFANEKGKPVFTVWNTQTKQIARTINDIGLSSVNDAFALALDGKTLLVDTNESDRGGINLYDLHTGAKQRCFGDRPSGGWREKFPRFKFSPDSRTLVRFVGSELQLWDIPAGKRRGTIKLEEEDRLWDEFFISADSHVIATANEDRGFMAWSLDTGERLWPPIDPGRFRVNGRVGPAPDYRRITPDDRYLIDSSDGRIDLLDPGTGTPTVSVSLGENFGPGRNIKFTPDGRWMLSEWRVNKVREPWIVQKWLGKWWPIEQPQGCVVVSEVTTGRTVLRISDHGASYDLSDDGNTLMSFLANNDGSGIISCFDVPGRPSRYLVYGIPLALGTAITTICCWRKRKRLARQPIPLAK